MSEEVTQEIRIAEVGRDVTDLLIRKNSDYGDSFHKQFLKYGLASAVIRMDDKMSRLEKLTSRIIAQPKVDESLEDTLMDLAGYAVLSIVELRKQKEVTE